MNNIDEYCKIMNIKQDDILNDPKHEFRYFCYKHIDLIKNIKLPELQLNLDNEVVLIEFRILPHIEFLLHNTINKIGNEWSYTIICGIDNYNFMKQIIDKISPNIKIIKLEYNNIDIDIYNEILTSTYFWNLFIGSKILIWQDDSCIFGSNINDFIKWDYIGSPWLRNDNQYGVGNGGLSLRTKSIMLEIINKIKPEDTITYFNYPLKNIPEDVYFTTNMIKFNIGKLAFKNEAYKFSNEQYILNEAFGGHNFFTYNKNWKELIYSKVINNYVVHNI
jgi:hypothetical protein